jgi:hypothetical protein
MIGISSMIYNYCLYLTIIFNISLINIVIYYLYILRNRFIRMSDKERIFVLIKELKYELIENFENYSLNDINEFIEDIIQIYIDNKCDFAEDYETKQKIYYNDIDVFIITKRKQIIEDINHKLLLNYNENFELSIIIS